MKSEWQSVQILKLSDTGATDSAPPVVLVVASPVPVVAVLPVVLPVLSVVASVLAVVVSVLPTVVVVSLAD
ncbi:MAG: hypothetical protein Kow00122_09790 [Thermoleophilia bacterium]